MPIPSQTGRAASAGIHRLGISLAGNSQWSRFCPSRTCTEGTVKGLGHRKEFGWGSFSSCRDRWARPLQTGIMRPILRPGTEELFTAQFSNTNYPREMGMSSSSLCRYETQRIMVSSLSELGKLQLHHNCLMSIAANTLKSNWKNVFSNTLTMKDLTTTSGIWGSW